MRDCIVIGGGLAGMAAAWRIVRDGYSVTLLEKNDHLGGLASSFERDGRVYPLGYHHILSSDDHLIAFLGRLGLLGKVRWKYLTMQFAIDDHIVSLSSPRDLLQFPMPWVDKMRLAARVASAWWPLDGSDENAEAWVRGIAGERVTRDFFDVLTRIKFGLPCADLSARWLRTRLLARESACRYGYIPGHDWVKSTVNALTQQLEQHGVQIRTECTAKQLRTNERGRRLQAVVLETGEVLNTRTVVCALAPPIANRLMPSGADPALANIDYTGVISTVLATRQDVPLQGYWTNFLQPAASFGGIFRLDRLNDTLGHPGMRLLNFCTHVRDRGEGSMLRWAPEDIESAYIDDFERRFSVRLEPDWVHTSRIPYYSPIFVQGYTNPPVRSPLLDNLFYAGNYRTFPVLSTTGSAMGSGWEAGAAVLRALAITPTPLEDVEAA